MSNRARSTLRGCCAAAALMTAAHCDDARPVVGGGPGASVEPGPAPIVSFGPTRFAGRVRALAVTPGTSPVLWAASASGGLWRSRNDGANWTPADDYLESLAFSTVAVDPAQPATMYAGSGEQHTTLHRQGGVPLASLEGLILRFPRRGAGVFRSLDQGSTWRQLASTQTPDFYYVNRVAVHPGGAGVVLAATATGLFRSEDRGETWAPVAALAGVNVLDVKFHPAHGGGVAAVAGTFNRGLFFSQGDATQWEASQAPTGVPAAGVASRIEVHPAPSAPGVWYALYIPGEELRLLRSDDGGSHFEYAPDPQGTPRAAAAPCASAPMQNNRLYSGALWVDPANDRRVILGGLTLCGSTDGGRTFFEIGAATHNDHHAVISHPTLPDTVLVANDGGVARITNWSLSTRSTTALIDDLGIQQFTSAARNAVSEIVIGGAQDTGTLRRDANGVWSELIGGVAGSDGMTVATHPTDPSFWFFGKSIARLRRSTVGGLREPCAAGSTATAAGCCIAGSAARPERALLDMLSDGAGCTPTAPPHCDPAAAGCAALNARRCIGPTPIVLDPRDPRTLYVGCGGLWRTRQALAPARGDIEWVRIKPPSAREHVISAMSLAASDPNTLWLGTFNQADGPVGALRDREVWVTHRLQSLADGASNDAWALAPELASLPPRPIARVLVHPRDAARVYLSFGGWASPTDSTASGNLWRGVEGSAPMWRDISAGLPGGPIHALAVHPTQDRWLYAGTAGGVYLSKDDGETWSATTLGPARVPISDLSWVGTSARLLVATYGRGVFEMDQRDNPERIIVEGLSVAGGRVVEGRVEHLLLDDRRVLTASAARPSRPMVIELTGRSGFTAEQALAARGRVSLRAVGSAQFSGCVPTGELSFFNVETQTFVPQAAAVTVRENGPITLANAVPALAVRFLSARRELRARLSFQCTPVDGRASSLSVSLDDVSWRLGRS